LRIGSFTVTAGPVIRLRRQDVPAQSRPGNALTLHFGASTAQSGLSYSPASLRVEGKAGEERTVHVAAAIQVPADYKEARLAFLIEPELELRGVKGRSSR
jgi:hypothetical protein